MVSRAVTAMPAPLDFLVIIDTHEGPARERVADVLEELLQILIGHYGRLFNDVRMVIATSDLDCGDPLERFYVAPLGIGTPEEITAWATASVHSLPSCTRSRPIETATSLLSTLRPRDFVNVPAYPSFIVFTDEDDPSANADFIAHHEWFGLVMGGAPSEGGSPLPAHWASALGERSSFVVGALSENPADWISGAFPRLGSDYVCSPGVTVAADAEGRVPCEMIEVRHPDGYHPRCADLPGRDPVPLEIDEHGFETCLIRQLVPHEESSGWNLGLCPYDRDELDRIPTLVNAPDAFASTMVMRCCMR